MTESTGQRTPRREYTITCAECGETFIGLRSSRKFCSERCGKRSRAKEVLPLSTCAWCGKEFQPFKPGQESCSWSCAQTRRAKDSNARRGEEQRGTGRPDTYIKYFGRHMHRVVAEAKIGRPLEPGEHVHHVNGIQSDNRPENLQVMTQSEHSRLHMMQRLEEKRRVV